MTIYKYDGLLTLRHLKGMFWPHATLRAAQKRLAKLVENEYLARPSRHQWRTQPIPEPFFWLGWRGILWIAEQHGVDVPQPASSRETQMRELAKDLRKQGIHWLREPRWIQLFHDLAVIDFRLTVERAVTELPALDLDEWRHESAFRADWDTIEYRVTGGDRKTREGKKRVFPDSYFMIRDRHREAQRAMHKARFLLEVDNATHSNRRFGREKVAPGLVYIMAPEFRTRFGDNSGQWLVVTTGKQRLRNLMRQTYQVAGSSAGVFLFTTFHQLQTPSVLVDPVWWQVGKDAPVALFEDEVREVVVCPPERSPDGHHRAG